MIWSQLWMPTYAPMHFEISSIISMISSFLIKFLLISYVRNDNTSHWAKGFIFPSIRRQLNKYASNSWNKKLVTIMATGPKNLRNPGVEEFKEWRYCLMLKYRRPVGTTWPVWHVRVLRRAEVLEITIRLHAIILTQHATMLHKKEMHCTSLWALFSALASNLAFFFAPIFPSGISILLYSSSSSSSEKWMMHNALATFNR